MSVDIYNVAIARFYFACSCGNHHFASMGVRDEVHNSPRLHKDFRSLISPYNQYINSVTSHEHMADSDNEFQMDVHLCENECFLISVLTT